MESFDLSKSLLSGILPSGIGNFGNLISLNLSSNDLSGQLPIQLSKLTHLQYLDLSSKKFQGKIIDKLPSSPIGLNMSNNNIFGNIPLYLRNKFDISSFHPGNPLLIILNVGVGSSTNFVPDQIFIPIPFCLPLPITIAVIVATVEAAAIIAFIVLVFLNDHLLIANSRSLSRQAEFETEFVEHDFPEGMAASSSLIPNLLDDHPTTSGKESSPGSPLCLLAIVAILSKKISGTRVAWKQHLGVVDVASCLLYLHDRGILHGNLKPTNILLKGPDYSAHLTDYGLDRLMTPAGIAEQILNLGALGCRAPELDNASKPAPSFKADQSTFTNWVRLCDPEGRRMDCIDRDIAGGEEPTKVMDDLLAMSLRCILPLNERPNIRQVFDDLCSISI
ncbi:hypothetical protein SADUNF_Sadunf07G0074900 [Salix dunnii]|uniref:Protein kinase domain-containing protein n=1 Tax=Salix dunnii TaxID=1413687 RepID=A0A835K3Q4_9ROSI|nr:hypothetical protein SADUNF_Sadunf07G0074900 [Salix dunnii]